MSSAPPSPSSSPAGPPTGELTHRIHQGEALFVALALLAGIGIGVTNFSPRYGFQYWASMVPLFGGVSAFLAWLRARARGDSPGTAIRAQLFHWLGVLAAIWLVFLLKTAGQLEYDALGLVALVVLSLATFLAGVHGDWRLCGVGLVLGAIAAAGAFAQQVVWLLLVPAFALIVVVVIAWSRRGRPPSSVEDIL
jgi:hypothetical protein